LQRKYTFSKTTISLTLFSPFSSLSYTFISEERTYLPAPLHAAIASNIRSTFSRSWLFILAIVTDRTSRCLEPELSSLSLSRPPPRTRALSQTIRCCHLGPRSGNLCSTPTSWAQAANLCSALLASRPRLHPLDFPLFLAFFELFFFNRRQPL